MTAVFKKEMRSFFCNPAGYIFIALFLVIVGLFCRFLNFGNRYPQFEYVLTAGSAGLAYLVLIPVLSMRSLSEERRQKTDTLLYALPIRSSDVVLGKFLSMAGVIAIPTAFICLYPLILSLYGNVNFVSAYAGILMFYCLGLTLCAVCMFLSSLTESQFIAAAAGIGAMLLLFALDALASLIPAQTIASVVGFLALIGLFCLLIYRLLSDTTVTLIAALALCVALLALYLLVPSAFEGSFASLLRWFALFSDLSHGIAGGYFDLTVIVKYASVTAAFLFFSVCVMEKRRWN